MEAGAGNNENKARHKSCYWHPDIKKWCGAEDRKLYIPIAKREVGCCFLLHVSCLGKRFHTTKLRFHTKQWNKCVENKNEDINLQKRLTKNSMEFIIGGVVYVVVCEGICKLLELDDFDKKAWVYAIVGVVGGFLIKSALN